MSPRNTLLPHVSSSAKNYSAQLFWEVTEPISKFKKSICELFLNIYFFSRNKCGLGLCNRRKKVLLVFSCDLVTQGKKDTYTNAKSRNSKLLIHWCYVKVHTSHSSANLNNSVFSLCCSLCLHCTYSISTAPVQYIYIKLSAPYSRFKFLEHIGVNEVWSFYFGKRSKLIFAKGTVVSKEGQCFDVC